MSEPDDPQHRTFVNIIAIAFVVLLCLAIYFVIKWLQDSQALQDCVISGRRDCLKIEAPPRP